MSRAAAARAAPSPLGERAYLALRRLRDGALAPPAWALARLGVPPAAVSAAGVALAASTLLTLPTHPGLALAAVLATLLCDALDGAVARRTHRASADGKLFDQACDAAAFTALAAAAFKAGLLPPAAALYAMAVTLLAVALAMAYRALTQGPRWRADPAAGFWAHLPKGGLFAGLLVELSGGPPWVEPATRLGNLVATAVALAYLVLLTAAAVRRRSPHPPP